MKLKICLAIAAIVAMAACKKSYTCKCSGPGYSFNAFTVTDTKKNADKKCKDYSSVDTVSCKIN